MQHAPFRQGLLALLAALPVSEAMAWDEYGHAIVARVAERHLTETAREQIYAFAPGIQLMSLASTMERKEATDRMWKKHTPDIAAWHFHSYPLQAALQPETAADCPETGSLQCAGAKIREHLAIVANEERSPNQRKTSLAFVVHLIGDIHQPLRTATDNDRNGKTVMLPPLQTRPARRPAPPDAPISLFDLWDHVLLKTALALPARQDLTSTGSRVPKRAKGKGRGSAAAPDRPSLAREPFELWPQEVLRVEAHARDLEAAHAGSITAWQQGTLGHWIVASHQLARTHVHAPLRQIGAAGTAGSAEAWRRYLADSTELNGQLLVKAGVRLARLLNQALAPAAP